MPAPNVAELKAIQNLYTKYEKKKEDEELGNEPKSEEATPPPTSQSPPNAGYFISLSGAFKNALNFATSTKRSIDKTLSTTYVKAKEVVDYWLIGKDFAMQQVSESVRNQFTEKTPAEWVQTMLNLGELTEVAQGIKEPWTRHGLPAVNQSRCCINILMAMSHLRMMLTKENDEYNQAFQNKIIELQLSLKIYEEKKIRDITINSGNETEEINKAINKNLKQLAYLTDDPIIIEKACKEGLLNHLVSFKSKEPEINAKKKQFNNFVFSRAIPWGLQKRFNEANFELKFRQRVNSSFVDYLKESVKEDWEKQQETEKKRRNSEQLDYELRSKVGSIFTPAKNPSEDETSKSQPIDIPSSPGLRNTSSDNVTS